MSCSDEKKLKIKAAIQATKAKRQTQTVKVREVKLSANKIGEKRADRLALCFLEAKWFYNDIIRSNDISNYDTKNKVVTVLDKDKNPTLRTLSVLSSQMKHSIKDQIISNIKAIATQKRKGLPTGKIGFKKVCNSIGLSQYNTTYKFVSNTKIKIQRLGTFHVRGLEQFEKGCDFANAKLVRKPSGFYLHITSYVNKSSISTPPKGVVGLDFGIKKTITTSDNDTFKVYIPETERLKNLQRRKEKQQKGSKNYIKTVFGIRREYEYISNRKEDAANKILSHLTSRYATIVIQNENLSGWHQTQELGKFVQHSCLGRVKAKIKQKNHYVVDQYFPSTKKCYICGTENNIGLSRTYSCSCGHTEERDLKAAKTILIKGLLEMGAEQAVSLQEEVKSLLEVCWVKEELSSSIIQ
jgi:putative transposase